MCRITADEKLTILVELGADVNTLVSIARVMGDEDFSSLADSLVWEYTGEGNTYDLWQWARLRDEMSAIFA